MKTHEWEDPVIQYYVEYDLQDLEETVLNELRAKLLKIRMLDIGVGAGRAMYYFAPSAKKHVGVGVHHSSVRAR